MKNPEYVFPAIVVQRAFASEKSGVLLTANVENGDPDFLTVAVNEGVSGVVDGAAAEGLLVDTRSGATTLLSQATAPERNALASEGGIVKKPTSGADTVLTPGEVKQLIGLAKSVPARFPSLRTASGDPVPADIEFGFHGGKLGLLQIRPFNESRRAQRSQYLSQLDAAFAARGDEKVLLSSIPDGAPPTEQPATAPNENSSKR
jgi:phosphoenolpyruvate synthase/pyruvate phosphate dikinase